MKMTLLESFHCSCPMQPETVSILYRSYPRVKSLSFDFEGMKELQLSPSNDWFEDWDEDREALQLFRMPGLTVFADLDKFSLLNLYGDLLQ